MLNSLTLKNFRQHENLALTFGAGMTAIRGANENGKTTVLEAVAYAMFGVKAIRDGLDDVVTWGCAANTLKVELQIAVDGVVYDIKRSKGGAEVNYDGGIVTGQNEVTSFVAKLLKVDATSAARLTMSNQGEIRGALEAGTKATTELIERLAEFDQIDKLIELMQDKLTLGSPVTVEASIGAAKATLERLEAFEVPTNLDELAARITQLKSDNVGLEQRVDAAELQEVAAQETHSQVRERIVRRAALEKDVERTSAAVERLKAKTDAPPPVCPDNAEARIVDLQKQIAADTTDYKALYEEFSPFSAMPPEAADRIEGSAEELEVAIATESGNVSALTTAVANHKGDIKLLQLQLTQGTCTFCGKDFSGVPEVEAKNAATRAKLTRAESELARDQGLLTSATKSLQRFQGLKRDSAGPLKALSRLGGVVALGDNMLPPYLIWTGPTEFGVVVDTAALERQIRDLQRALKDYESLKAVRASEFLQLGSAMEARAEALAALDAVPAETIFTAQQILDEARTERTKAATLLNEARSDLKSAERDLKDHQDAQKRRAANIEDVKSRIVKLEADLATLEFNNALLKRVRQARPILADKLWTIVLTAVSAYFSEIRGVPSTVSKDKDGFKVDEHSVTSMSGSTLDALGLAIRVALVRTFLPSAAFLLLDEPAAAMDGDRTNNMLGFLSTCGFQQILLVTHEEVSDAVADHLLAL